MNNNPFIEENSFYYVDEEEELTEYAAPSLPENRTRGLQIYKKSELFEQLTAFAELKNSRDCEQKKYVKTR